MKIIEWDFPVEKMNILASKESVPGFGRKPIYSMHKWWARRVGGTFRAILLLSFLDVQQVKELKQRSLSVDEYERLNRWFWGVADEKGIVEKGRFYRPVDLRMQLGYSPIILDPFMGGGTTIVEALRLGCKVIGIDLNSVAWFVTKMEVEPVSLKRLDEEFEKLKERVGQKIKAYYKTLCPKCITEGVDEPKVDAVYVFWVKKVPCVTCGEDVRLYHNFIIAKKGKKAIVFCPKCITIFETRNVDVETACPGCQHRFTPSKGHVEKGKYTCPECGQKYAVLDTVRLHLPSRRKPEGEVWYPEETEIFAVEYYCPKHGRDYKSVGDYDRYLYRKAVEDFHQQIGELKRKDENIFGTYIPNQKIPQDKADPRPNNYGYEYFWQMFNERQLLCLSMLLEKILKVEDRKVKEFMLMVFSDIVDYNNTFCEYIPSVRHIGHLFARHAYWPRSMPCENNVWGAGDRGKVLGTGSFAGFFKKSQAGVEFMDSPFEKFVHNKETVNLQVNDGIRGKLTASFEELASDYSLCNGMLVAKDAQDLSFIPDRKVDAVVTDPPYYDNVMYGELADFYYVWLRLGLKDSYKEEFGPLYTLKEQEIVVNQKVGKTEKTYIKALSNVFAESRRVLKDEGLLAFTYHHTSNETWAAILESVLDSGFYIIETYPIYGEHGTSTHIRGKEAREFDTIIVAKKRLSEPEPSSWEKLKDEIYVEAGKAIERVLKVHPNLSNGDRSTIILGKCLEVYSRHWPKVLEAGKPEGVGVREAIEGIRDIIQDLYVRKGVPKSDRITEFYLEHLMKEGGIEYNELLKIVQSREITVSIDELKAEGILAPKGSYLVNVDPHTRGKGLSERMESTRYAPKHYVDLAHLYYYLFKEGKRLPRLEQLGEFDIPTLASTLKYMAKELKEETYTKILNLLEGREREPKGLEKFMR